MSPYDDPYAWERKERYLAAIHGAKGGTPGLSRVPRTCPQCHRPMWQKHAETCTGPPPEPACDCPPGYQHLPGCVLVTGETP